jgi:hypothetical protein
VLDSESRIAVLDACALAPMPIVDTLLRLAETQIFYIPKWSPNILAELSRTLLKFGLTRRQAERRIHTMSEAFPDALVRDYEELIPGMGNDSKDRHVLAAAVKCSAQWIVSDNRRHFPVSALAPHKLACMTVDAFLFRQSHRHPTAFRDILVQQAADINGRSKNCLKGMHPRWRDCGGSLLSIHSERTGSSPVWLIWATPRVASQFGIARQRRRTLSGAAMRHIRISP